MQRAASIFLTLLLFHAGEKTHAASNQKFSAPLSDLYGLAVPISFQKTAIRSQLTGSIGYGYDLAGNLAGAKSATPGGYDVSYDYDALNRLTDVYRGQQGIDPTAAALAAYTLNKNGHRTQISELSGRTINHTFDALHRLTSEAITPQGGLDNLSQPSTSAGTLSYSYDAVSNRTSRTLSGATSQLVALLPNQAQSFTPNDRLTTDTYDANGNTTTSTSTSTSPAQSGTGGSPVSSSDVYSFDNRLIRRTTPDGKTIDLTHNPDGHRLTKLIAQNGLTQRLHHYLTDANNPTGYAQVIEEKDPLDATNPLRKVHLYGHDLISTETSSSSSQPSTLDSQLYYSYDGLGSVRSITDTSGELQETYDYDAYGTLIGLAKRNATSGELESSPITNNGEPITKSEFLFTGEQWDADLGMYFLRARYLNTHTGRFHNQDTYEGRNGEPITLHKYLYANGNPVSYTDPSGYLSLPSAAAVGTFLFKLAIPSFTVAQIGVRIAIGAVQSIAIALYASYYIPTTYSSVVELHRQTSDPRKQQEVIKALQKIQMFNSEIRGRAALSSIVAQAGGLVNGYFLQKTLSKLNEELIVILQPLAGSFGVNFTFEPKLIRGGINLLLREAAPWETVDEIGRVNQILEKGSSVSSQDAVRLGIHKNNIEFELHKYGESSVSITY